MSPSQDILLDNYNPHFFLPKSSQFTRLHCTRASFFLHLHQSSLVMAAKKPSFSLWFLHVLCSLDCNIQLLGRARSHAFPSTEGLTLAHLPLRSLALSVSGSGSLGEKPFVTRSKHFSPGLPCTLVCFAKTTQHVII